MSHGGADAIALLGGRWAHGLQEVSDDLEVLDGSGRWAVVVPYEGKPTLLRFATWASDPPSAHEEMCGERWVGPALDAWASSMGRDEYCEAVTRTRASIADGTVYQANICRVLAADLPEEKASMAALHARLLSGNPAPYGGFIDAPEAGVKVVTASPELFLERDGERVRTGPIKGTAATVAGLLEKDWAENVMIVDLMRNDLGRICQVGSVVVPALTEVESHPGLVHLVSRVEGRLAPTANWARTIEATFPPGSVTGAPKSSALRIIDALETAPREVYCGAIGWVDADRRQACLAVAIRTFWHRDGVLRFGTGAGITWESDPQQEWQETQLKARRLLALAAGNGPMDVSGFDS
jgi:para-aminobenzoate synthetase component 1